MGLIWAGHDNSTLPAVSHEFAGDLSPVTPLYDAEPDADNPELRRLLWQSLYQSSAAVALIVLFQVMR